MFTRNFDLMTIHTTLPRHLTFTVKTENWVSLTAGFSSSIAEVLCQDLPLAERPAPAALSLFLS